ncbi:Crp/Fnr family transcriptional regulator [Nitrosococcus watsonii]|uniref:Transcriptional regulator, Crp/Fnr family n=1 Tax=Nitrosococcus watsoni (strain C-113) TaxID=105559 RepID=D8K7C8_NITWC|nr:cyclic nucleotide-binding domain-containing protein [Nitrosococcus watsonii]ADJ28805.1 transcriptional regulator, Crp/Fnr family [Nitrosococcus watsonii C-113]
MPLNTLSPIAFSPEDLALLRDCGITRTYPKHTILIHEGDHSDSLYIILSGKVKVYISDEDGKEVILRTQKAGEYFGELALLDKGPRSASVMALEKSRLSVVSKTVFNRCLTEHPDFALKLLCALTQRIRSLTENVKNLALLDVYGRVARTLLDLAIEKEGKLIIEERPTHQEIAQRVGASREMVSRIMGDLATGGYIEVTSKTIIIPHRLPSAW